LPYLFRSRDPNRISSITERQIGYCLFKLGQDEKAAPYLERARNLGDKSKNLTGRIAYCKFMSGNFEVGILEYEKTLDIAKYEEFQSNWNSTLDHYLVDAFNFLIGSRDSIQPEHFQAMLNKFGPMYGKFLGYWQENDTSEKIKPGLMFQDGELVKSNLATNGAAPDYDAQPQRFTSRLLGALSKINPNKS